MKEIVKKFVPKSYDLMNGVFSFYKKKSFPEDIAQKGYIKANCSTCYNSLTGCLGTKSDDISKMFHTASIPGSWIQIKMKYPVYITHYSVYQCDYDYDNKFYKWEFDGSNDGLTWFALDNYSLSGNTTMQRTGIPYLYTVRNPGKYEFIKMITYKTTRIETSSHLVLSGFEIFGNLEYPICYSLTRSFSYNIYLLVYFVIYLI